MNISQKCVDLVKEFEGCRLDAYLDVVGVPTIGYGHIEGVKLGDEISQQEADLMLIHDLQEKADAVNKLVRYDITQEQFDALVSFAYNLGVGALAGSTLLKMINAGSPDAAADQFLRWDHAGGVEVAGLTRRREAEKALYEGDSNA